MKKINRYIILSKRLLILERLRYYWVEGDREKKYQWCRLYNQTKRKVDILEKINQ